MDLTLVLHNDVIFASTFIFIFHNGIKSRRPCTITRTTMYGIFYYPHDGIRYLLAKIYQTTHLSLSKKQSRSAAIAKDVINFSASLLVHLLLTSFLCLLGFHVCSCPPYLPHDGCQNCTA
jgi:hypothetical protein